MIEWLGDVVGAAGYYLGGLQFTVMLTRGGAVRWFRVARLPTPPADGDAAA